MDKITNEILITHLLSPESKVEIEVTVDLERKVQSLEAGIRYHCEKLQIEYDSSMLEECFRRKKITEAKFNTINDIDLEANKTLEEIIKDINSGNFKTLNINDDNDEDKPFKWKFHKKSNCGIGTRGFFIERKNEK